MKIIVDTCIWSMAFRRNTGPVNQAVVELEALILDNRAQMLGPIRQEVLSGIKAQTQFERLRQILGAFPDLPIERSDYERAALFFTACRRRGIQGSNTDFLICAVAHRYSLPIFTQDRDFTFFQTVIDIQLYGSSV
ncbi:MAG: PIN domain-containing protein [Desulfatitalea sp.]|nr:PIN domain-containing protein [Desulfatitalea sp.]